MLLKCINKLLFKACFTSDRQTLSTLFKVRHVHEFINHDIHRVYGKMCVDSLGTWCIEPGPSRTGVIWLAIRPRRCFLRLTANLILHMNIYYQTFFHKIREHFEIQIQY